MPPSARRRSRMTSARRSVSEGRRVLRSSSFQAASAWRRERAPDWAIRAGGVHGPQHQPAEPALALHAPGREEAGGGAGEEEGSVEDGAPGGHAAEESPGVAALGAGGGEAVPGLDVFVAAAAAVGVASQAGGPAKAQQERTQGEGAPDDQARGDGEDGAGRVVLEHECAGGGGAGPDEAGGGEGRTDPDADGDRLQPPTHEGGTLARGGRFRGVSWRRRGRRCGGWCGRRRPGSGGVRGPRGRRGSRSR
jgi:hypothetical protein